LETILAKKLLDQAVKMLHQNPLSVDVILGYLFAKEVEIKNLKMLTKGKQLKMDESFLRSIMVVGG